MLLGLLVASCGSGEAPENRAGASASATTPAANAAEPPATAPPAVFSAAFMAGKWSAIDEDCSVTLEFRPDGSVTTPIGDAKWSVAGDRLEFDYGDGSTPTVSMVKALDPNRIEITHESGTKEIEKRC